MKKIADKKPKKVTINDLAVMIADGRKETKDLAVMIAEGREETSELARMVAKGFESIDKKIDKEIGEVKKDIAEVKENLAGTRRDVLEMGDRFVPRYEFHNLLVRIDRLEQKVKAKK